MSAHYFMVASITFKEPDDTVDKELKYAVNGHMCTDFCPCKSGWDFSLYGPQANNFEDYKNNDYNFDGDQTIFTDCYADRRTLW